MKFKVPLLVVEDINKSREFYEKVLNQKVILDFGANITFEGDFSLQSKESWADFIKKDASEIVLKSNNFELYFEEEDFDNYIQKIMNNDLQFVHGAFEYSWGQRVIRFYDPDMHIIEVGEAMEKVIERFYKAGFTIEEIVEKTQHPEDYVQKVLETPK